MKLTHKYVLIFSFAIGILSAQDVHFSQFLLSPLTLNPANTGNFKGDLRLFGNYRTQWRALSKGYNTFSAGGDVNLFPKNRNIGIGLFALNDLSAENLSVTKVMPSAALHLKASRFKFHLGIQPGIVLKTIDFYRHSFPEQLNWGTGKFDNTLPNTEPNVGQRFIYFDANAGASISAKFGAFEPLIGYALFHINQPRESFLGNTKNKLPIRQAYNVELKVELKKAALLHFYSLYGYTTKTSDWVSGINFEYILSRDAFFTNSIYAGFMWRDGLKRNSDAAIFTCGMNISNYTFGFSFDLTQSQLKTSVNNQGAYELAIIYRTKSTRLTRKIVPCDRF